jgi:DNA-binding transcriptional MerR regulator/methylmalonyl-CoA mutase cobalamin-binding subunit
MKTQKDPGEHVGETDPDVARHPMAVVVQRTGLTSHAIRAWERRYGVVAPTRSDGGHRLYSDREVERLRLLHRLTLGGRQIGQLASLTDRELANQLLEDQSAEAAAPRGGSKGADLPNAAFVEEAFRAVLDLDSERLDVLLRRAVIELDPPTYLDDLMAPLLQRIGQAWVDDEVTPAHEHLASGVVRAVSEWLLEKLQPAADAPILVVATPAGQVHELGALAAAIAAASAGWGVRYLGADLPAADIALAVERTRARALALSLLFPQGDPAIAGELRSLREAVSTSVPILVGGGGAESYSDTLDEIGAIRIESLGQLRKHLLHRD